MRHRKQRVPVCPAGSEHLESKQILMMGMVKDLSQQLYLF